MSDQDTTKYLAMGVAFRATLSDGGIGIIAVVGEFSQTGFMDITKRHFRGLSPDYDVGEYLCGICKQNFEMCPHVNVPLIPTNMKLRAVSVVRDPQMGTKFTDVLCVKTKKNRRSYRWIGFRAGVDSRQDRIDEMMVSGQISETAATVFKRYFESRKSGDRRFVETLSSPHPRGTPDYTNLRLANAKWKI